MTVILQKFNRLLPLFHQILNKELQKNAKMVGHGHQTVQIVVHTVYPQYANDNPPYIA
jgi:hypothetical protein